MILTQKHKLREDDEKGEDDKWQSQIRKLQFELETLQGELEEKQNANQELLDKINALEKNANGSNFNEKKLKDLNRQLEF